MRISSAPVWAILNDRSLMESYFDIQYGHDGKLGGFVYDSYYT